MFWVEPCESESDTGTGDESGDDTGTETPGATDTETPGATDTETDSDTAGSGDDTEVLGTQASTAANGSQVSAAQGENGSVPTAVDAGESGHSAFGDFVRSPWPLVLVGFGALLTIASLVARRRHGVDGQE